MGLVRERDGMGGEEGRKKGRTLEKKGGDNGQVHERWRNSRRKCINV